MALGRTGTVITRLPGSPPPAPVRWEAARCFRRRRTAGARPRGAMPRIPGVRTAEDSGEGEPVDVGQPVEVPGPPRDEQLLAGLARLGQAVRMSAWRNAGPHGLTPSKPTS
nr:hypothetical protein GCM10020093_095250 [Planobispora longispora]